MKAIAITEFGGKEKLTLMDLPQPVAKKGEVLIRVKAAGINPVDCKIRNGMLTKRMPYHFPIILGWDASGVVEKTGEGVSSVAAGDAVFAYCRTESIHAGAYAEYIALPENNVAKKPSTMSFEEAASVPLAGLTAYQALFDAAQLKMGETVLIHRAAGGVGGFAVQLASTIKARVIGTAREANHQYILSLGADMAIDYTQEDFEEIVLSRFASGIHVVLDTLGEETTFKSIRILAKGGRLVSIASVLNDALKTECERRDVRYTYVFVSPNSGQLTQLARFIEEGQLRTHLAAVLPLEQADRAHEMIERGHTRGKIVVTI